VLHNFLTALSTFSSAKPRYMVDHIISTTHDMFIQKGLPTILAISDLILSDNIDLLMSVSD
jgi:hypothetical protein